MNQNIKIDGKVIQLIHFDKDGVLVNNEWARKFALAGAMTMAGVLLENEKWENFPTALMRKMNGLRQKEIEAMFLDQLGPKLPMARINKARLAAVAAVQREFGVQPMPGVIPLVRWAASSARCTVVSSSSKEDIVAEMLAIGLDDCFKLYLGAKDVKKGKPDPEGYLQAASFFDVSPANCVVIEDASNGVEAGAAAGMHVLMVPDLFPATERDRELTKNRVFPDMAAAHAWLQEQVVSA